MFDATVQRSITQSVQTAENNTNKKPMPVDGSWDMWGIIPHAEIISPWGYRRRDRELRTLSYAVHNGLFQGAIAALIMRVQAVPWEVKGGRNLARYYQDMLQNSDFHDWETWIARILWDFFTQDFGAVTEVIGGGSPDKKLIGRVTGLAHMDSLSCWATKSTTFPIIYWNEEDNGMHQMHQTRAHRMTDMISPQRTAYGTGISALSRYLSEANVDILLGRHDNEMLMDLPPAGLLAVSGMTKTQWTDATRLFETDRRADGQSIFRQTMILHAIDPTNPLKIESIPFSALPENFDTEKFVNIHVNKLALSLGVDPQDIWPLSGQALGTGTQSTILNAKARGKMFGRILQMITRFLNRKVLPPGLEFQFKFKDSEEDLEVANIAKVWCDFVNSASWMTDDEKRDLMAQQVEVVRDVITDENGEVIALPDDDPKEEDQEVIAPDDNPLAAAPEQSNVQANLQSEDGTPNAGNDNGATPGTISGRRDLRRDQLGVSEKAYGDTASAFVGEVAAAISDASDGTISKAAFAIRMRAALSKYGKAAYLDGLAEGGVEVTALEGDDSDAYARILSEQSQFVSNARGGITDFSGDPDARAQLWEKSLKQFHMEGLVSADKNGMYSFEGDDGDQTCATCQRLKGQKHRLKDWIKKKFRPGIDTDSFDCGTWPGHCHHFLEKTTGKAVGNW